MTSSVGSIEWDAPWLAGWWAVGEPLAQRVAAGASVVEALNAADACQVSFASHFDLPEGTAGLPWRPVAQRLQQQFEQHWANSRECPELRPLRL